MYIDQSDAQHKLRDPLEVHVSLPDESTGMVVYVDQLAYNDLVRLATETEVGEAADADAASEGNMQQSDPSLVQTAVYPDPMAAGYTNASDAVLLQKMPTNSAEEATNAVYVVQMNPNTFTQLTSNAAIAPEVGGDTPLDIEALAQQVFADVKERLAVERERLQPFN